MPPHPGYARVGTPATTFPRLPFALTAPRGLLQAGPRQNPVAPGPVGGGHGTPALGLDL